MAQRAAPSLLLCVALVVVLSMAAAAAATTLPAEIDATDPSKVKRFDVNGNSPVLETGSTGGFTVVAGTILQINIDLCDGNLDQTRKVTLTNGDFSDSVGSVAGAALLITFQTKQVASSGSFFGSGCDPNLVSTSTVTGADDFSSVARVEVLMDSVTIHNGTFVIAHGVYLVRGSSFVIQRSSFTAFVDRSDVTLKTNAAYKMYGISCIHFDRTTKIMLVDHSRFLVANSKFNSTRSAAGGGTMSGLRWDSAQLFIKEQSAFSIVGCSFSMSSKYSTAGWWYMQNTIFFVSGVSMFTVQKSAIDIRVQNSEARGFIVMPAKTGGVFFYNQSLFLVQDCETRAESFSIWNGAKHFSFMVSKMSSSNVTIEGNSMMMFRDINASTYGKYVVPVLSFPGGTYDVIMGPGSRLVLADVNESQHQEYAPSNKLVSISGVFKGGGGIALYNNFVGDTEITRTIQLSALKNKVRNPTTINSSPCAVSGTTDKCNLYHEQNPCASVFTSTCFAPNTISSSPSNSSSSSESVAAAAACTCECSKAGVASIDQSTAEAATCGPSTSMVATGGGARSVGAGVTPTRSVSQPTVSLSLESTKTRERTATVAVVADESSSSTSGGASSSRGAGASSSPTAPQSHDDSSMSDDGSGGKNQQASSSARGSGSSSSSGEGKKKIPDGGKITTTDAATDEDIDDVLQESAPVSGSVVALAAASGGAGGGSGAVAEMQSMVVALRGLQLCVMRRRQRQEEEQQQRKEHAEEDQGTPLPPPPVHQTTYRQLNDGRNVPARPATTGSSTGNKKNGSSSVTSSSSSGNEGDTSSVSSSLVSGGGGSTPATGGSSSSTGSSAMGSALTSSGSSSRPTTPVPQMSEGSGGGGKEDDIVDLPVFLYPVQFGATPLRGAFGLLIIVGGVLLANLVAAMLLPLCMGTGGSSKLGVSRKAAKRIGISSVVVACTIGRFPGIAFSIYALAFPALSHSLLDIVATSEKWFSISLVVFIAACVVPVLLQWILLRFKLNTCEFVPFSELGPAAGRVKKFNGCLKLLILPRGYWDRHAFTDASGFTEEEKDKEERSGTTEASNSSKQQLQRQSSVLSACKAAMLGSLLSPLRGVVSTWHFLLLVQYLRLLLASAIAVFLFLDDCRMQVLAQAAATVLYLLFVVAVRPFRVGWANVGTVASGALSVAVLLRAASLLQEERALPTVGSGAVPTSSSSSSTSTFGSTTSDSDSGSGDSLLLLLVDAAAAVSALCTLVSIVIVFLQRSWVRNEHQYLSKKRDMERKEQQLEDAAAKPKEVVVDYNDGEDDDDGSSFVEMTSKPLLMVPSRFSSDGDNSGADDGKKMTTQHGNTKQHQKQRRHNGHRSDGGFSDDGSPDDAHHGRRSSSTKKSRKKKRKEGEKREGEVRKKGVEGLVTRDGKTLYYDESGEKLLRNKNDNAVPNKLASLIDAAAKMRVQKAKEKKPWAAALARAAGRSDIANRRKRLLRDQPQTSAHEDEDEEEDDDPML